MAHSINERIDDITTLTTLLAQSGKFASTSSIYSAYLHQHARFLQGLRVSLYNLSVDHVFILDKASLMDSDWIETMEELTGLSDADRLEILTVHECLQVINKSRPYLHQSTFEPMLGASVNPTE